MRAPLSSRPGNSCETEPSDLDLTAQVARRFGGATGASPWPLAAGRMWQGRHTSSPEEVPASPLDQLANRGRPVSRRERPGAIAVGVVVHKKEVLVAWSKRLRRRLDRAGCFGRRPARPRRRCRVLATWATAQTPSALRLEVTYRSALRNVWLPTFGRGRRHVRRRRSRRTFVFRIDESTHGDDVALNPAREPHINDLIAARLSRRSVMGGGLAAAASFLVGGKVLGGAPPAAVDSGPGVGSAGAHAGTCGVARLRCHRSGIRDEVVVPVGYSAAAVPSVGHPDPRWLPGVRAGHPAVRRRTGTRPPSRQQQMGMHHDGMHYFPLERGPRGSQHGLLVVNHEARRRATCTPARRPRRPRRSTPLEMVRKSQAAHGVSVVEIAAAAARGLGGRAGSAQPPDHRQHADVLLRSRRRAPTAFAPPPTRGAARRWARSTTARTASRRGAPT